MTTSCAKFCFSRPCELVQATQDSSDSNFHTLLNTDFWSGPYRGIAQ